MKYSSFNSDFQNENKNAQRVTGIVNTYKARHICLFCIHVLYLDITLCSAIVCLCITSIIRSPLFIPASVLQPDHSEIANSVVHDQVVNLAEVSLSEWLFSGKTIVF